MRAEIMAISLGDATLSPDPDGRLSGQLLDFRGKSLRLLLQLGALLFELAGPLGSKLVQHSFSVDPFQPGEKTPIIHHRDTERLPQAQQVPVTTHDVMRPRRETTFEELVIRRIGAHGFT